MSGRQPNADRARHTLHTDNNIFTQTGGSLSVPSLAKRMILMSTYEEFMILLTSASLVVAILNLKNKK